MTNLLDYQWAKEKIAALRQRAEGVEPDFQPSFEPYCSQKLDLNLIELNFAKALFEAKATSNCEDWKMLREEIRESLVRVSRWDKFLYVSETGKG